MKKLKNSFKYIKLSVTSEENFLPMKTDEIHFSCILRNNHQKICNKISNKLPWIPNFGSFILKILPPPIAMIRGSKSTINGQYFGIPHFI